MTKTHSTAFNRIKALLDADGERDYLVASREVARRFAQIKADTAAIKKLQLDTGLSASEKCEIIDLYWARMHESRNEIRTLLVRHKHRFKDEKRVDAMHMLIGKNNAKTGAMVYRLKKRIVDEEKKQIAAAEKQQTMTFEIFPCDNAPLPYE